MDSNSFKNDGDGFARPGDPKFTNFPKHTPEDTVFYSIYVVASPPLTLAQSRSRSKEIQASANEQAKALLKDYIWQRESFSLELEYQPEEEPSESKTPSHGNGGGRWRLSGKTEFGDSITDEWVIAYLLRELTQKFKDAWVRVTDSDGEFLLAEAAYSIPRWLNPDVAENRVWIHDGGIRLIPESAVNGVDRNHSSKSKTSRTKITQAKPLSLESALSYISSHPSDMIKSSPMDSEAFFRLRNYPDQIAESMHTAVVTIPRLLAHILHSKPAHVSPATEAFYLRDPVSVKPLQQPQQNLVFSPNDLINASVRFTRVGYAQLRSQEFPPPPAWAERFERPKTEKEQYKLEMGMKLTCGFEMLISDPGDQDKKCVREIRLLLDEIESGEETLPSDSQVAAYSQVEDDESWLDINYEEFENELSGRKAGKSDGAEASSNSFGDRDAQENLHRIVDRFQQFIDDEDAGLEGADFGATSDSDEGSENGKDSDEDEEEEEEEAELNEDDLIQKMQEMMYGQADGNQKSRIKELDDAGQEIDSGGGRDDSESESDGPNAVEDTMAAMEKELRSTGALNLDPPEEAGKTTKTPQQESSKDTNYTSDPQYLLVKNLLESLQGEGRDSGPARNLIASMGLGLPKNDPTGK